MTDIKHPAADALNDERTYAADIDMSRDAAEQATPRKPAGKRSKDEIKRDNADAIAAATSQTGQT